MGISSDGRLYFGFALATEDNDGDLSEVDLAKIFGVVFETEEAEDTYEEFDFETFLEAEAGLLTWRRDMTDKENTKYWKDQKRIVAACPVSLESHCSYDCTMYVLAVAGYAYSASRGEIVEVEPFVIDPEKVAAAKQWCEAHNVTWHEPKWLLCSMYG